jgi:transposase
MRKTALRITHQEVTRESLNALVSGHGIIRKGLRIAVLQALMDEASITDLSRRHHLSREGIYLIVKRVNERGLHGLDEEKRPGRPGQLTPKLKKELTEVLNKSPHEFGYTQPRWDGTLLCRYLETHHGIHLGHSQINRWLHALGFSLKRGRQTLTRVNPEE